MEDRFSVLIPRGRRTHVAGTVTQAVNMNLKDRLPSEGPGKSRRFTGDGQAEGTEWSRQSEEIETLKQQPEIHEKQLTWGA